MHMVPRLLLALSILAVLPGATLRQSSTMHTGGLVRSINTTKHTVTIFSSGTSTTYTIEVLTTTKMTIGTYPAALGDLATSDHLTVVGTADTTAGAGPNVIAARIVRISSPKFGGVVTAVTPTAGGGAIVIVRGRHGHLLRIDATAQSLVYTTGPDGKPADTAHAADLVAGTHISAHGTRVGKFELAASGIHVYPHQHTVGGTVTSALKGAPPSYLIRSADGSQYLVQTTSHTVYTLNGKLAAAAAIKIHLHVRVHGYNALHHLPHTPISMIASHISVTVHVKVVRVKRVTHAGKATPTGTPTTHKTIATPTPTP